MADLFGVRLVSATTARISQDCARRFAGAVRDHVAAAAVKRPDETGFRIGGKTQWLHIACTTTLRREVRCNQDQVWSARWQRIMNPYCHREVRRRRRRSHTGLA